MPLKIRLCMCVCVCVKRVTFLLLKEDLKGGVCCEVIENFNVFFSTKLDQIFYIGSCNKKQLKVLYSIQILCFDLKRINIS